MNKKEIHKRAQELEAYFNSFPDWYWALGLHDAKILSATPLELEPDWMAPTPRYNCLELALNAKGAMYDTKVAKITFYNYKLLTPDFDLGNLSGAWWYGDTLTTEEDGKYRLELHYQVLGSTYERDYTVELCFSEAEVERKK